MNSKLNQQIIDKYILDEFGEIPNPPTENEIIQLINSYELTLEQVKLWSLFGSNLMIKGYNGNTILHSASKMSQLNIVEYVLDKGNEFNNIDVDYLNNDSETPLIYASCNNQIEVINYLLDRGANINHQDKDGWSALHFACEWNKLEAVKVLVDRGVDIHLIGNYYKKDETALDVAKHWNYQEIIDYLEPFYNKQ